MGRLGLLAVVGLLGCHGPAGETPDAANDAASGADSGADASSDASLDAPARVIEVLQGVDRASAFTATEAHTLKTAHDVQWTGVYIGGACSAGSGWTKAVVTTLATNEGWTFMPTWVGQQAPSICGASTLTAGKGQTDGAAAAQMMQTFGWDPNRDIPVALDLEAGSYTHSPSGAIAYAGAWRDAVRTAGYLAYLYSSPTAINALFDAGVKFDGVWPASWFYTGFHDTAPDDLDQLGTRYTDHVRAWQYAGEFAVTGAGSVDADVSDLLLAPTPGGTNK